MLLEYMRKIPESEEHQYICQWVQDEVDGYWHTNCGEVLETTTPSPSYKKMQYCPYCGKKLR